MIGIIVALAVVAVAFIGCSYFLLRKLGVREKLTARSVQFGLITLILNGIFQPIFATVGMIGIGQILGTVAVFFYVRKVLVVNTGVAIAIAVLLPIIAALISAPILLLVFNAS